MKLLYETIVFCLIAAVFGLQPLTTPTDNDEQFLKVNDLLKH